MKSTIPWQDCYLVKETNKSILFSQADYQILMHAYYTKMFEFAIYFGVYLFKRFFPSLVQDSSLFFFSLYLWLLKLFSSFNFFSIKKERWWQSIVHTDYSTKA